MGNSGSIGDFFQSLLHTSNATPSALTTQSGYSPVHVLNWQEPRLRWQSNVKTPDQWLKLDLSSSPPNYVGVYLDGLNLASATLQANATDTWGAPTFNLVVTFTLDDIVTRRHGVFFFNPTTHASIALRYVRLLITASTATDDGANYKVSSFFPLVSSVEVLNRPQITLARRKPVVENQFPAGRHEILSQGDRAVFMELPWSWLWDPTVNPTVNEEATMLALATDKDVPVCVCRNLNKTYQSYLCRQLGDFSLQSEGVGARLPLIYEEIT